MMHDACMRARPARQEAWPGMGMAARESEALKNHPPEEAELTRRGMAARRSCPPADHSKAVHEVRLGGAWRRAGRARKAPAVAPNRQPEGEGGDKA